MKALEHPAYIRMIVNTDHHLAFATAHEVDHALVVFERKVTNAPCQGRSKKLAE
jgi:hypothetical protein